ncbi:MAG: hypothetical protein COS37_03005 [Anaerolineae bacterium CG03_land_8_20_14_0_80_58_20]|nr:MAG: hypothetical protein COS37_03005 [Anaerolineae bacterium CG03_land_8_20_14_0_80_58_20]
MAKTSAPKSKKPSKSDESLSSFSIEPGTKVQITIEAGQSTAGKVPINIRMEHLPLDGAQGEGAPPRKKEPGKAAAWLKARFEPLIHLLKAHDLATWLFIGAVTIYLATRLIGLTQFPIYFFSDEAIQTQSIADLVKNDYRDQAERLLPTYFKNGEYTNLGVSVYLQWLPYIFFGKSAFFTRATSVLITLLAAISVGIILRNVFKARYWWTGALFLSITPAWFLHSRTAFETAEFTAFYAGTLCAYLLYRYRSPRYLYPALFLGALGFYAYSPAQLIVPILAIALLVSDWRYHWENRSTLLKGWALAVVLALPYIRFRLNDLDAPIAQLHVLGSYWVQKTPVLEKVSQYFSEYGIGISPWYWYQPNDRDLQRHRMKDYGNIMVATLPFAILGMAYVLRFLRESSYRTILIAVLVSPVSAALVQTGITRVLIFVVPAAILTALGLERLLQWMTDLRRRVAEPGDGSVPAPGQITLGAIILLAGCALAYFLTQTMDRVAVAALAILLGLQLSGALERFGKWLIQTPMMQTWKDWRLPQSFIAVAIFVILAGANVSMLSNALRNGPLWYTDYGMGGMQYGAFQIFDIIKRYQQEHPNTRIIFSPSWANGTDVVARFFLDDSLPIELASIEGHIQQKLPLDDDTLFIMIPDEYNLARGNSKFKDIRVEKIVPFPNGAPGFYFVRLRYADGVDEMFAAEKAFRDILQETAVTMDGEEVEVRFSYLDSDAQAQSIAAVFDNDPYSLAKTYEANPFVIEMTFPSKRKINGFSIIVGQTDVQITLKCYSAQGAQPVIYTFEGQGTQAQPKLSFDLPGTMEVEMLRVEILNLLSPPPTNVHIWELLLH